MTLTLKSRVQEWRYWHVRRPLGRLGWKVLKRVPHHLLYWAVIQAAVITEPNKSPEGVTALEMLKHLESA